MAPPVFLFLGFSAAGTAQFEHFRSHAGEGVTGSSYFRRANVHPLDKAPSDTAVHQGNLRGAVNDNATVSSSSPETVFQEVTHSLSLDVLMGPLEKQLFDEVLSRGTNYFEYGVGGSTLFASQHHNLKHISAVDSSSEWIAKVRANGPIAAEIARGRISIEHLDVGPVKAWGYPIAPSPAQEREYSKAVVGATPVPDVVLVDGRYRVACALRTALEAAENDWPRLSLLIHDYERIQYSQYVNALLGPPTREQGSYTPGSNGPRLLAVWELARPRLAKIKGDAALLARIRAQLQQSEHNPQFLGGENGTHPNASNAERSEAVRSVGAPSQL